MATWEQTIKRCADMSRQEMIDYICASGGYITELPREQQGKYLFGKTKNERGVCLIRRDDNDARVTMHIMELAYYEIAKAGLKIPYLFFGTTCFVVSPDIFTFAQIPYCFDEGILRTLQGMNMRANLHVAVPYKAHTEVE